MQGCARMNIKIYYFSGTGNSLLIAEKLGKKLGNVEMDTIARWEKADDVMISSDHVVIVCPVYFFEIPGIVRRFLERIQCSSETTVRAVVTCGGDAGYALYKMERQLRARGLEFKGGLVVPLAENSLLIQTPEITLRNNYSEAEKHLDLMVRSLRENTPLPYVHDFTLNKRMLSGAMKGGLKHLYRINSKTCSQDQCNQCGICEKVCPVNNIEMQGGYPRWKESCEQCFACINWCRQSAIRFGRIKANGRRYTHPDVNVVQIINQK